MGIEWLSKYNARLDCRNKKVKLCSLGKSKLQLNLSGKGKTIGFDS